MTVGVKACMHVYVCLSVCLPYESWKENISVRKATTQDELRFAKPANETKSPLLAVF